MAVGSRSQTAFTCAVTWWLPEAGPHLWRVFQRERVAASLRSVAAAGIRTVRVPLAWDAFMPSPRRPHPQRLRDLETVLRIAHEVGLGVVPVLFVQSFGDCVLLPEYAVDRRRARPGVRVVSDGIVQSGGPRDPYTDPLMLELGTDWLQGLLDALAGHPALRAWDLGHDPASTVRPRRIGDLVAWAELMAALVHEQDEPVWFTLGAADVLSGRGVRLGPLAGHVDALGLVLGADRDVLDSDDSALFTVQLAQRLLGDSACAVLPHHDGDAPARYAQSQAQTLRDATVESRAAGALLDTAAALGCAGMVTYWTEVDGAVLELPPFDHAPWLAQAGLVDAHGDPGPALSAWTATSRQDLAVASPQPWPAVLDVDAYYANLPLSARDLHAQWRRERGQDPAMLR